MADIFSSLVRFLNLFDLLIEPSTFIATLERTGKAFRRIWPQVLLIDRLPCPSIDLWIRRVGKADLLLAIMTLWF